MYEKNPKSNKSFLLFTVVFNQENDISNVAKSQKILVKKLISEHYLISIYLLINIAEGH